MAGLALSVLAGSLAEPCLAQRSPEDYWSGQQDFLNRELRPLWDERYENYSFLSYRDYGFRPERPTYDPFGSYLVDGVEILRIEEYGTLDPARSSRVPGWGLGRFRNMVILRDAFGGWSTRFMIGNLLDGRFTPLTLNLSRLEGLRWDASSHRNSFSLISSRVPRPLTGDRHFTHYLFGGHWSSQFGDILTFGASYVNLHLQDAAQRNTSLRGDVPSRLTGTSSFYLVISDDSPEDEHGVDVYAVELYAGQQRLDVDPEVKLIPQVVEVSEVPHIRRDGAWAPRIFNADRIFVERSGLFAREGIPMEEPFPLQVGGTDLLVLRYEVPGDPQSLRFRVQVSGDYSLDVGAAYGFFGGGTSLWSDWHNVKRAPGNVQDGSNMGWVTVDYGFPTGLVQFGSTVEAKIGGANLEAEYISNVQHARFPFLGRRENRATNAWYVRLLQEWSLGDVGLEIFHVPPTYQVSLPVWSEGQQAVLGWDLVEDNDDGDEWPDKVEHWDPLDPVYIAYANASGIDVDAIRPDAAGEYGLGGGHGVFPGLDQDEDGVVDTNVNRNQYPDYLEPFLMYYVEPDDFVYGEDFNNNGVVDVRENDNKADLPYDLDSRGYHGFASVQPFERAGLRLGRYRVRQRAAAGRNEVTYGELGYTAEGSEAGRFIARWRLKRVRDDIPNPLFEAVIEPQTQVNVAIRPRPDLMLMENSLVSTLFAKGHYTGVEGLNLIQAAKVEWNNRRDSRPGLGDDILDWSLVSKADYAHVRGRLTLSPMVKFTLRRRTAPGDLLMPLESHEIIPILRADYALSEDTTLRAGVQGLPWLHRFREAKAPSRDFDARHWIVLIQNLSNYTGYDVSTNLGFRSSRSEFVNLPSRRVQRLSEFFIQARIL